MKCFCGCDFILDKDIPSEHDRCPNCNRNIYDIKTSKYIKKLETSLQDWLFDLETYGSGFIFTNCDHYKIQFKQVLNEK